MKFFSIKPKQIEILLEKILKELEQMQKEKNVKITQYVWELLEENKKLKKEKEEIKNGQNKRIRKRVNPIKSQKRHTIK